MALSQDQKKHLAIGGGLGALAIFLGSMILGHRKAFAGPRLHGGGGGHDEHEHHDRRKKRSDGDGENDRGEYGGGKKKHRHKEHGHGD